MKTLTAIFVFIFAFALSAAAQDVRPTPSPTPAENEEVVKISTSLVQVDVTVTDRKGKVVRDLKPEDFEIYENGEKQKVSNFSFVAGARSTDEAEKPVAADGNIPAPPKVVRPEQVRRTIALVVDDLTLSFESAYQTRRALKKFVDEQMQDGDLVAIIRTGGGIGALQQFTTDKRQLHAAIERVRWNPLGRGNIGAFAPIEPTPLEIAKATGDSTVSDEDIQQEKNAINSFEDFRGSIFATGTLGALRFIVTGMGELPGRKSVIMFSDGFRLLERDSQGFSDGGRVLEFLRQIVDLANRSSVVFYTVDARGLQTTGITAQDQIIDPTSPDSLNSALSDRRDELFETQGGLAFLAEETGGLSIRNSNDLSGGVKKVLDDQSYYLIGYTPDSETFDAAKRKFNKLEIKVNRPGVKVRYRSGFFNVAEERIAKAPTAAKTPVEQIKAALTSPFALNEISLRLNPLFGDDPAQGPVVRSLLHVNARDLKFADQPDGSKKAVIQVLAASFGDNGTPVDQIGRSYTLTVGPAAYRKIEQEGFVYHFAFPVKKPGAYQYRVAVRDDQSGRVGSASQFIEVPNLKKSGLTLSSIVLQSFAEAQWQKYAAGTDTAEPNAMNDTALRRFKSGSVLRYGFEVYNAKLDASRKPSLTTKIRIYRDGQLVLDGQKLPFDMLGQTDVQRLKAVGALSFSQKMTPGDYVLQIIVTDNLGKEKHNLATQFVQFEVEE